ncbi:MAG: hypothetical protein HY048_10355 [Acidobacteria bacterium]|nr:hypothetical protein [Acidobacteriota bacterium]
MSSAPSPNGVLPQSAAFPSTASVRFKRILYKLFLGSPLGDDATFGLIELLDSERKDWSDQVLSTATDRFERRLTEEVAGLRHELHQGLNAVRQEIATTRVDMLKWSFLFWIGQVATMAALMSFMLRGR